MPPLVCLGFTNAACAAVLAVAAAAVGRWLRRPALTHCVWLLVLVKLITPPLLPFSLEWLPAPQRAETGATEEAPPLVVTVVAEPVAAGPPTPEDAWLEMEKNRAKETSIQKRVSEVVGATTESDVVSQAEVLSASFSPTPASAAEVPAVVSPASADVTTLVLTILGCVWLAGSVLWFVRALRRLIRFHQLLRHARPAPARVQMLAARLARQFGLRRCPQVSLLPSSLPPMIWAALGRVRVLLPAGLLERLEEEQVAALLAHELAHVRRGDHWVRRFEFIVLGLYWWYPLAWWARARLQAAEEECCDAWVVDAVPARSYASAIVATVDFLANDLAAVPVLASGLGRLDGLKRRLTLILTGPAPKRLSIAGRLAVLALGLALLPLLPTLVRSENKADIPAKAESEKPTDSTDEALAFLQQPLSLIGGENQVAALAVSADGKYLAAGTGFVGRPGAVRIWTVAEHKEVLAYATAQGVASVAFSPDGRYIASSGYDGQAVIRDFPSGKVVTVLALDGIARLCYSPDGESLITVTEAKTIKIWNAKTGAETARIENPTIRCYCLAYSPDGKFFAVGGGDLQQGAGPNEVIIWDAKTLKPVGKLANHGAPVMSVVFSKDSQLIATGSIDTKARLWQVDGFKLLGELEGHEDWVKALTFTPDGKTLVTGSHDGSVRLWDVQKRMPLNRLDGHVAPVRAVAVSPDGVYLFTGGAERILKVWDLTTFKETASYQPRMESAAAMSLILAAGYSPDGRLLATVHESGVIAIRNAANGDLIQTLEGHEDAVNCVVFAKDGKTLLSGSSDRTVRLWDVETGKVRATLPGHTSWVYALALSPDGKTLASAGYDKTVRLWDLETHKELAVLTGHKGAVRALAFAPDGKTLASGAGDHTITFWDLETHKNKLTLTGHEGTVRSLAFAPDGKTLVSGSEDASVRLWDVETGKARAVLKGHNNKVSAVTFSPHGRYVVSASMDSTWRLWDASTGRSLQTLRGHSDALTCLAWAPDGRFLITAGYDKTVLLWIVTTGPLRNLTGHTGAVRQAVFTPDSRFILSCSGLPNSDKTLRLWDIQSGKEVRQFTGHTDAVNAVALSSDGKFALSAGMDKTIRLWDVETGKETRLLEGNEGEVRSVAFAPNSQIAAAAGHDKKIRIWDLETGKILLVLEGHGDEVHTIAFTADGKRLVSGSRDHTIRVWDIKNGAELLRIDEPKNSNSEALAVSLDGTRAAAGGDGPALRLWNLETGKLVRQFDGHDAGITSVAFAPDGKSLLTGSYDRTARLWDVETGRELHLFRDHRNIVWSVNFSPDGRRILSAGGGIKQDENFQPGNDYGIRVWPLPDTSPMAGRVLKINAKPEK
jgi:WD40 repeat protein/beta-lactamase regulating signal transducer with metallopeptidase domain